MQRKQDLTKTKNNHTALIADPISSIISGDIGKRKAPAVGVIKPAGADYKEEVRRRLWQENPNHSFIIIRYL